MLCAVLVISGGWIALASRQTAGPRAQEPASPSASSLPSPALQGPSSFLNDRGLSASPGVRLGNGELFFRMMLSVGLIVGLGAAALYVSKRVLPKVAHTPGKEIHVLETAHLGPHKTLHLVEVGGQRLLLASTSDCITLLAGVPNAKFRVGGPLPVHETWSDLSQGSPSRNFAMGDPVQELGEAVKA